jgi:hypothetical protein
MLVLKMWSIMLLNSILEIINKTLEQSFMKEQL